MFKSPLRFEERSGADKRVLPLLVARPVGGCMWDYRLERLPREGQEVGCSMHPFRRKQEVAQSKSLKNLAAHYRKG